MTLKELLATQGVKKALIVDDVVDSIPTAADIAPGNPAWASFNDDLTDAQRQRIGDVFPDGNGRNFADLIRSDQYVAALWKIKDELGEIVLPVFAEYLRDQEIDGAYVDKVRTQLQDLGLAVAEAGRDFVEAAQSVDLVIIDLYLGKAQAPAGLQSSKDGLKGTLAQRLDNPPMVILMSRSNRLESKRDEFRDDVGLLDSGFRILKKEDLGTPERLENQLERLVQNRDDSIAFAKLLVAFEKGVAEGAGRALRLLRKLRLSDIGQIQQLLLNKEEQPVGSYLVDVFDRVLQHEIEREDGIITAALALNSFSTAKYPPPYVAGSADLQELVQRILTQNENRLKLPASINARVSFGDLLKVNNPENIEQVKKEILVDIDKDNVLLVLTPACDLQRRAAPRVLLLVGTVKPLAIKDWTYSDDARTPTIRIDDKVRWVKWNLKHIDTVSLEQLDEALENGTIQIAGRLREGHALELQQRVLSGLGRIGQMVTLPGTFPVDLDVFYVGADQYLKRLDVAQLTEGAVCFTGSQGKRLMLTETMCDGITDALARINLQDVAELSQTLFKHVTSTKDLQHLMSSGFDLQGVNENWKDLPATTGGNNIKNMGLIAWNAKLPDGVFHSSNQKKAGVVFVIRDIVSDVAGAPPKDIPGLNAVRHESEVLADATSVAAKVDQERPSKGDGAEMMPKEKEYVAASKEATGAQK